MFALLLFSSAGLFDEYNTHFHLLSVSAPGAVGHAIRELDGWDGMDGWDGWDGRSTFFFGPYLENYYIIFFNCFSSLKYMDLKYFLEYSRKKIGMFFFSKSFAKIGGWFFF